MATEASLVKAIDKIRSKYPNWHQLIPFLLQRFGQSSKMKKHDKLDEKKLEIDEELNPEKVFYFFNLIRLKNFMKK